MVNASHIRAARALLDWSRDDLAAHAGIAKRTLVSVEQGAIAYETTWGKLRSALESAGVEFIFEDGRCIGVLLRSRSISAHLSECGEASN
jgi:DNA-binding XRE family transcriptional regulator